MRHRSDHLRRQLLATRPQFLGASLLPVLVGSAWGAAQAGAIDLPSIVLALLATTLLHAAANVLNDLCDADSDAINSAHLSPFTGGSRFIQDGLLDLAAMRRLSLALLLCGGVPGLVLAALKGPGVLAFGLAGVALGVAYSLPPLRLNSRGLGELTVAIAFGILPVLGAAWLQTGEIEPLALLAAAPASLWIAAVLLVNEVPDRTADAAAGKRTLAVRMGLPGVRWLYGALQLGALAVAAGLVADQGLPWWSLIALVVVLVPLLASSRAGWPPAPADRAALLRWIQVSLGVHNLGCLWLVAVLLGSRPA
ncbi:MAG: prenyltransferase [Gammaproteobacteria bacterium]|nr:MAG: prenyltransferase [Gammaproteobacteria bacterium]